jgi:ABC-type transport system involved in multi-copper enzyme maturation permease subunit
MGSPESATPALDRKWPLRAALFGWLAIGVGAWFAGDWLSRPGQVLLGGLWLVGLGLLLRQFIQSLFGPVLAYDVLRVGRRRRQIWFRVAYAVVLAFLFTWVYMVWRSFAVYGGRGPVRMQDMSKMAEAYFQVYMIVQFIMVCLLTPASVAGAITDEKERRTLEFLLATDLRDREILFGKLASRVGSLLLFLLAGLPILGMVQFFGGIDPDLVIAGFAATFLTVFTFAAIAIPASVLSRRTRDAIALTYLLAIAYCILSGIFYIVSAAPPLRWSVDVFGYDVSSEDIAYPFVCGNPFYMVPTVLARRAAFGVDLFTGLLHYSVFHIVVIAVFVTWAGMRLRLIALRQRFGGGERSLLRRLVSRNRTGAERPARARRRAQSAGRPDIGDSPVVWKEVFVDSGLRMGMFSRFVVILLVVVSFAPAGVIFWVAILENIRLSNRGPWWSAMRWDDLGEGMNGYLRVVGTIVSTLVFLAIAVRGAGCITGERDRHTLDVLLTTPMSAGKILWGKWWGCLLGMRWAWVWVFAVWILALAAGGVHPVVFPAMVLSVAIYASGFAWIGLYCSLTQKTSLRATMAAIVLSVLVGGGYFLVVLFCCGVPLSLIGPRLGPSMDRRMENLAGVVLSGLCSVSPSVNLAWLPIRDFEEKDRLRIGSSEFPLYPPFWILGLIAWGVLSVVLSRASVNHFRRMANRIPIIPEPVRRRPPPLPRREPPPLPPLSTRYLEGSN